jgi:phosphoglycolate phosphatase
MKIQAIIFDLDGTLLNTIDDIAEATNFSLLKNGFKTHSPASYQEMVGLGLKNLIEQALDDKNPDDIDRVFYDLIQYYMKNPVKKTFPYEGIVELLENLQNRNLLIAILSNKMHEITIQIVKMIFKQIQFNSVYGSRENVPKKPDPTSAFAISSELGVLPENILFVGDSSTDIKTAINAGMIPVGVSWGYRSVESIEKAGARFIIHQPGELLNYLDQNLRRV